MGNKIYDRARDSKVHFKNTAGNKVTVNAVINVNTLLFDSPQHIKTFIIKHCQAIFDAVSPNDDYSANISKLLINSPGDLYVLFMIHYMLNFGLFKVSWIVKKFTTI